MVGCDTPMVAPDVEATIELEGAGLNKEFIPKVGYI